jgi:type IV secretory pathway VirB2 component (pilin)
MRFFVFVILFYIINIPTVFAVQKCNSNDDCRQTWICVNGTANNGNQNGSVFTGICKPNIVMRQVCLIYNLATGVFGKAMTLLAIAAFGGKYLLHAGDSGPTGIKWQELLTIFIGIAFIFGAPQIINIITKNSSPFCDFGREN